MSDDRNVVDFGARAALERSRLSGFLLTELDGRRSGRSSMQRTSIAA